MLDEDHNIQNNFKEAVILLRMLKRTVTVGVDNFGQYLICTGYYAKYFHIYDPVLSVVLFKDWYYYLHVAKRR